MSRRSETAEEVVVEFEGEEPEREGEVEWEAEFEEEAQEREEREVVKEVMQVADAALTEAGKKEAEKGDKTDAVNDVVVNGVVVDVGDDDVAEFRREKEATAVDEEGVEKVEDVRT